MTRNDRMVHIVKALPSAADVHVDQLLTDFSVGAIEFSRTGLVSSIFPSVPVNNQTNKYRVWPRADFLRDEARKRAPLTEVPRGGFRLSEDNYYCDIYNFGTEIADETLANADNPAEIDQALSMYVMNIMNIRSEVDFVSTFMTSGIWGTSIVGVASGATPGTSVLRWDVSGSTTIEDVEAAKRAVLLGCGKPANTIAMGYDVRRVLKTNAQIVARLVNGQTPGQVASVTDRQLSDIFDIPNVVTGSAVYNTAKEGQTASMSFVAGDFVWVGYVDPNPRNINITAGCRFVWNGMEFGSPAGTRMERYYERRVRGWMIDGFANWANKVTAADAGYFFSDMVS